jgi:acyl-CoA dehydrogenase
VLGEVLDRAIQTARRPRHARRLPLAWWYRHERAARIYDGPDEVHMASVGKRILERGGMRKKGE